MAMHLLALWRWARYRVQREIIMTQEQPDAVGKEQAQASQSPLVQEHR